MISNNELKVIEQYIDKEFYDTEKLIKYLNMHDIVGNEIFSYCDRKTDANGRNTYTNWLDDEYGYTPLPVKEFVHRIPFYFYAKDRSSEYKHFGSLHELLSAAIGFQKNNKRSCDEVYDALDYMFYHLKLSLTDIFSYWIDQAGTVSGDLFFQWNHYLHLCEDAGIDKYYPERFITAYNMLLEHFNMPLIIYEVGEAFIGELFIRNGTNVTFEGQFPCDNKGNPILKWIGVDASNIMNAKCTCEKSKTGRLTIEITPKTIIRLLNVYNNEDDDEDYWYQVYAGPQTMEFDYEVLKEKRKQLKYTQQEVADAIGATVRTYQKWENGETTPDGHYLLRLMNWLDITDVQNVVKFVNCQ